MDNDDFGDDSFDEIPVDDLLQLEQKAWTSTQQNQSSNPGLSRNLAKSRPKVDATELTDLRKAVHRQWQPPRPQERQGLQAPDQTRTGPQKAPSDYGFDDEDVVDLDEPTMVVQSARGSRNDAASRPRATVDPETEAAYAAADAELAVGGAWKYSTSHPAENASALASLRARVAELEADQARLRESEQQARNAVLEKQGEIAIVRANQEKQSKEFDRRIAVMQKLHVEESAKHKAALEAGRKERERAEADNRFLQHDLMQEAERARRSNDPSRSKLSIRTEQPGAHKLTPKKTRHATAHGDGFDDDEVVNLVSPSASTERRRQEGTPRAGSKRKRAAQDSPVAPLLLTRSPSSLSLPGASQQAPSENTGALRLQLDGDRQVVFLQRFLRHRMFGSRVSSMHRLSDIKFSALATTPLSSIIMSSIAETDHLNDVEDIPVCVARGIANVWAECLMEHMYEPVAILADLLSFSLHEQPSTAKAQLIEDVLPVCIRTVEPIAQCQVLLSNKRSLPPGLNRRQRLTQWLDCNDVMELLQTVCFAAGRDQERIEMFWRTLDFNFTLLMLNKAQRLYQITTMLRMIATSALPTFFGPVHGTGADQAQQERDLIDRLTNLLFETPEVPSEEPAYSIEEIIILRLDILHVLRALCLTEHGSILLAQHANATGRLVRFLESILSQLYRSRPDIGRDLTRHDGPTEHSLLLKTIKTTVFLLYHLFITIDSSVAFHGKVMAVKGGFQRLITSLTHIAFSEQLLIEAGIEEDVMEAAHAILHDALSPEEGEAVLKAMETPRGTRGVVDDVNVADQDAGQLAQEESDVMVID